MQFKEDTDMNINYTDLIKSGTLMWQGMAAIFVVMAAIALVVYLFTKFSK